MTPATYEARAIAAEARGDYDRAAMWWNYAAQAAHNRPGREAKTHCFEREDAAKARALEAA